MERRKRAQVRTEGHAASEIVALTRGTCDGHWLAAGPRYVCPPRTPPAQLPQIGELQETFGLEPLQQLPALVILQSSTGPVSTPATHRRFARDFGYSQGGKSYHDSGGCGLAAIPMLGSTPMLPKTAGSGWTRHNGVLRRG